MTKVKSKSQGPIILTTFDDKIKAYCFLPGDCVDFKKENQLVGKEHRLNRMK